MEISCRGTLSQEQLKLKVEYDERFGTRILFFFESNRFSSKAATGYWTVLCGYLCISSVVEWTFEVTKYMFKFCIPDGGCYNYWEIFLC